MHSKGGAMNITGKHAPHSASATQEKLMYYHKLREVSEKYGRHNQYIIAGDFSAKIVKRLPEEEGYSGQYVFNPENKQVDDLPDTQVETEKCSCHLHGTQLRSIDILSKIQPKLN